MAALHDEPTRRLVDKPSVNNMGILGLTLSTVFTVKVYGIILKQGAYMKALER